jgi:hypothetical protein
LCAQVVAVVGTKADLAGRRVSGSEGREWAAAQGHLFFEVRAPVQQLLLLRGWLW